MKRCPTCNRTYLDEQLSYCTDDGTPLEEQAGSSSFDPQATLLSPPPRETSAPPPPEPPATQAYRSDELPRDWSQPPSWSEPSQPPSSPAPSWQPQPPPAPSWNAQAQAPPPAPQGWSPPPPPGIPNQSAKQNPLAIASLVAGIFSMTFGLCCYLGFLTGPVAIGLGFVALNQIKTNPNTPSSAKGMAMAGIGTGAAALVIILLLIVLGVAMGSFGR